MTVDELIQTNNAVLRHRSCSLEFSSWPHDQIFMTMFFASGPVALSSELHWHFWHNNGYNDKLLMIYM